MAKRRSKIRWSQKTTIPRNWRESQRELKEQCLITLVSTTRVSPVLQIKVPWRYFKTVELKRLKIERHADGPPTKLTSSPRNSSWLRERIRRIWTSSMSWVHQKTSQNCTNGKTLTILKYLHTVVQRGTDEGGGMRGWSSRGVDRAIGRRSWALPPRNGVAIVTLGEQRSSQHWRLHLQHSAQHSAAVRSVLGEPRARSREDGVLHKIVEAIRSAMPRLWGAEVLLPAA